MSTNPHRIRYKYDWVKLPKLSNSKSFRVKSASKQTFPHNANLMKDDEKFTTYDKYRSNSLKTTESRKNISKKFDNNESDDEVTDWNKSDKIVNQRKTIQRQHIYNMEKLERIAKLFDPKTMVRMRSKKSDCSQEESRKQNKPMMLRVNHLFEGKGKKKQSKKQQEKKKEDEQFWKQINESLILGENRHEEEPSKQFIQIYETFTVQ